MIRIIFIMILSSLALIGLIDLFHIVKSIILKANHVKFSIVLPVRDRTADIEFAIQSLSNTLEQKNYNANLIIADLGMDFETLQICYAIAKDNPRIIICNPKEVEYFSCEVNV